MCKRMLWLSFLVTQAVFANGNQMTVTSSPMRPTVFKAPLVYANPVGEEIDVPGPWTRIELSLMNHSPSTVRITGVHFRVVATEGGVKESDFTPEQFAYNINCDNNVKFSMTFESFGEIPPNEDGELMTVHKDALPTGCQNKSVMGRATDFVLGQLPQSASTAYQVYITVRGLDLVTGVTVNAEGLVQTH